MMGGRGAANELQTETVREGRQRQGEAPTGTARGRIASSTARRAAGTGGPREADRAGSRAPGGCPAGKGVRRLSAVVRDVDVSFRWTRQA